MEEDLEIQPTGPTTGPVAGAPRALLDAGVTVICAGGGGTRVLRDGDVE